MAPKIMRIGNNSSTPARARNLRTGGETGITGDGDTDIVAEIVAADGDGDGEVDDDTEDTGVIDIADLLLR